MSINKMTLKFSRLPGNIMETKLLTVAPTETACEIPSTKLCVCVCVCVCSNTEHIKEWTIKTENISPI